MAVLRKCIVQLQQLSNLFVLLISLAGTSLFVVNIRPAYFSYPVTEWVTIYALVAAVLLLDHFMFQLPPEGNQQSMDSSVYLASVFLFGGRFTLTILFISFIFLIFFKRKTAWWKHVVNFSIYTFMICASSIVYQWMGGDAGAFDVDNLLAYLLALTAYSAINVLCVGVYYFLLYKVKLFEILSNFLKEAMFAYMNTLLLSLVLVILIWSSGLFGLLLFLIIGMLLSHSFKQLFLMYNDLSVKANKDQRTDLYNHSYFEEKLDYFIKQYREYNQVFSLAMLDLDDFKKYNDTFGHPQGDRLLGFFGKLIKSECEPNHFVAARYGGEEFAIIMPGLDTEQARQFINGLRKKVNDAPFDGVEVFPHGCISFSAGILEISSENYDKSQLVERADRALYMAKSKGKNTVSTYGEHSELPQRLEQDINEIEQQIKIFLSKDVYTYKHSKRVFSYAVDMAEELQLNEEDRRTLILGALIHDIGKVEIPRDILNKKTKLTAEEWEIVKKHVLWGKEIVLATGKYKDLLPLIELHHERYDGSGYPHGLKGREIPRLARMLCIIDSFDAMTTERPYQNTKSFQEALRELKRCSGTQFDPELAERFTQYIETKMGQDLPV